MCNVKENGIEKRDEKKNLRLQQESYITKAFRACRGRERNGMKGKENEMGKREMERLKQIREQEI